MTVDHKGPQPSYETFEGGSTTSKSEINRDHNTDSRSPSSTEASSANMGLLAQRLGSEGLWSETFVASTPTATIMTPTESSVAGDERDGLIPYPEQESYPDEPPPSYTVHEPSSGPSQESNVGQSDPEAMPSSPLSCTRWQSRKARSRLIIPASNVGEPPRSKRKCLRLFKWLAVVAFFSLLLSFTQFMTSYIFTSQRSPPPIVPYRNITQRETTNSIHGTYALYDLLDLSTLTGSIHVTVDLQSGTEPAILRLASKTGTIHVTYTSSLLKGKAEKQDVYNRELHTTIQTTTGTIHANSLLHGNGGAMVIESTTGSIHGNVYMVGASPDDNNSTLVTRSGTGSQHFSVKPLASQYQGRLTALRAEHHTTSTGSMHINYPSEWEGVVHAFSRATGSVNVKGKDLQYQHNGSKDVYAWRGKKDNKDVTVEVISDATGSIHFRC